MPLTLRERVQLWWSQRNRTLLPIVFAETAPLDLRIVGRMLFHAALVGAAAGLAGAAFFAAVEYLQRFLLEDLAGWAGGLMNEGAPLVHRLKGRLGWELRLVVQGGSRILEKIERMQYATLHNRPVLRAADTPILLWRALRM